MASIELRGIRKSYGGNAIIHGADLTIGDGEFVALIGPSGCGKSTLLRMIAGLEDISGGEILIDGRNVNTVGARERNIAMVFQNYALYPHMTVAENMGFNLKIAGKSRLEIRSRVEEAARMLDLVALLDRRPSQLSGGQRQRVAMGRAVVRNPVAFLFDEPLSNLDAMLRVQMRAEIKTLHQRLSTTSIYVTHDQVEAMTLSDRIVVLNQGRIEQQGSPLELYRKPANRFVAEFIGSPQMNFLDAEIVGIDGRPQARINEAVSIALAGDAGLSPGQRVTLGLRPEHVVPARDGSQIGGEINLVEITGAQTHVRFHLDGCNVTATVPGDTPFERGSQFTASIDPGNVHVFDRDSGRRLANG
jgi:multiple sugar transport system ATP-binding protein